MRKFLLSLALLAFMALPADAAWNIRQKSDGTAEWVNGYGETVPIGAVYLTAHITDVSTAQTVAVVVPITGAKVTLIQSVLEGDITTANATVKFWNAVDEDGTVTTQISDASTGSMTLTAVAATELGDVDTFTPTTNNKVEQGGVIFIHTDGGSTNRVGARFTITIQPAR
jgi:hypothetical protein